MVLIDAVSEFSDVHSKTGNTISRFVVCRSDTNNMTHTRQGIYLLPLRQMEINVSNIPAIIA